MKFVHVALSCSDLGKTEKFYSNFFGFKRARYISLGGDNAIIFIKCGDFYLELFSAESLRPIPQADKDGQSYPGWRHIAFQVESLDAFMAEFNTELDISLGPLDFSSFIPNWKSVWIKDPDGNIIEVSQGYQDDLTGA